MMDSRLVFTISAVVLSFVTAAAAKPPAVLLVRPRAESVGMYEKVELVIELEAEFQNPFDPDEIDLQVEFTSPSGETHRVWGFFNPTTADSVWMARFAPTEAGVWKYVVHVRDKHGTASGAPGSFTATPSCARRIRQDRVQQQVSSIRRRHIVLRHRPVVQRRSGAADAGRDPGTAVDRVEEARRELRVFPCPAVGNLG